MSRSSHRLAAKRSLEDMSGSGPTSKTSPDADIATYHRPKAGDTAQNNDCGVLPGE